MENVNDYERELSDKIEFESYFPAQETLKIFVLYLL